MSRNKMSISFKDEFYHVYEYLKTKENVSRYICKLVEADMQNVEANEDLDTKVEKIVYRLLLNSHLLEKKSLTIKENQGETETLSSEDIDIINTLF
ncbi:hypothetical protein [Neobacillus fumarioli]|uniref:hypothetical protein n=1 Tax=Neobacillus fumarioli TaxID=105229 RepID=UPI0008361979|nr:hypothetical protein [Neobacillus fumarioli]